jgi:flavin reductase (DIM6/NTAB) family NADH-FMN oxidoreductase RutF
MNKREMGAFNYLYPLPAVLVGAAVNDKPNYAVLGNCGIISMEPCAIYISSLKRHYTNIGIRERQVFSINIPSVNHAVETDYCGIYSGAKIDKSDVFESFYGKTGAPMAAECPVNLECKVVKTIEIYMMEVFIGEVVNSYIDESCLNNGKPDALKINPLIYDISNVYRCFGEWEEQPFHVGKKFKKN